MKRSKKLLDETPTTSDFARLSAEDEARAAKTKRRYELVLRLEERAATTNRKTLAEILLIGKELCYFRKHPLTGPYGKWKKFVQAKLGMQEDTANNYKAIAENWDAIEKYLEDRNHEHSYQAARKALVTIRGGELDDQHFETPTEGPRQSIDAQSSNEAAKLWRTFSPKKEADILRRQKEIEAENRRKNERRMHSDTTVIYHSGNGEIDPSAVLIDEANVFPSFAAFDNYRSNAPKAFPVVARRIGLDSGAYSIRKRAQRWAEKHGRDESKFYLLPAYFLYLDRYVQFVQQHQHRIDFYSNADAIGYAKLSYRNQKYLEFKGLTPIPVVHFRTSIKELKQYIDAGYELIGIGGLVRQPERERRAWLHDLFLFVCDTPDGFPRVKLHGFGIGHRLIMEFPWFSADSTNWIRYSEHGRILVPRKRKGQFVFDEHPHVVSVTDCTEHRRSHFEHLSEHHQKIVEEWLKSIKVPLGRGGDGRSKKHGVTANKDHVSRQRANLLYLHRLQEALPYPRAYTLRTILQAVD